jgi:hypothetical protein
VALTQFIVLKRKGSWAVKSNDQERSFSAQLEAMHAAIQLANECGKNGKPSVVLLQTAKKTIRYNLDLRREPFSPLQVRFALPAEGVIASAPRRSRKRKEAPLAGAS